jgi:hypothetical protein
VETFETIGGLAIEAGFSRQTVSRDTLTLRGTIVGYGIPVRRIPTGFCHDLDHFVARIGDRRGLPVGNRGVERVLTEMRKCADS